MFGAMIAVSGLVLHYYNLHDAENVSFAANSLIFIGAFVGLLEFILREP